MSSEVKSYINKKNQAPSYCDRVIYKNNTSLQVVEDSYSCLHHIFGSDHRPVCLSLTIKDFKQPDFADIQKLLAEDDPIQGYGQFDIEMIDIRNLDLNRISKLTKFEFSEMTKPIQLRVSFFDCALDTASSPIIFSQEKLVKINASEISVTWEKQSLPSLHSALNTVELAKRSRLMMFIWACGPTEHFPNDEMLLG